MGERRKPETPSAIEMSTERKLKQIVDLMASDDSVDAPADSVRWVKNLFLTRAGRPSIVKRIVAVLTADLAGGRPALGERSASAAAARQLFFVAGEQAIDLRISKSGKWFEIRGQLLGQNVGGEVVLEGTEFAGAIGTEGGFALSRIPAGRYDLVVKGSDAELVAENIELG
jgi:hypothetical protein